MGSKIEYRCKKKWLKESDSRFGTIEFYDRFNFKSNPNMNLNYIHEHQTMMK